MNGRHRLRFRARHATTVAAASFFAWAAVAVAAPGGPPGPPQTVPVRELDASQTTTLLAAPGLITTWLSALPVKTATMVDANSLAPGAPGKDIQRGTGVTAGVYVSHVKVGVPDTGQVAPPEPLPTDLFAFKVSADAAQAWATMSPTGQPFMMLWLLGQSTGQAVASWRAPFAVPGIGSQAVFLQVTMPGILVTGFNEAVGPSQWRSRFRADLSINGVPGWFTDIVRFNELYYPNGDDSEEKARHLTVFGSPTLGHVDGPNENTDGSVVKTLTLFLGTFPGGSTVDVSFVMKAEARVERACDLKGAAPACTRATVRTDLPGTGVAGTRFLVRPSLTVAPPGGATQF